MFSPIWLNPPADLFTSLEQCIENGFSRRTRDRIKVFFRADDVAVPGKQFSKLAEIFVKNRVPLSPAIVPAWLTEPRWLHLKSLAGSESEYWCWHQHGWRHCNNETTGRKQEFGPCRDNDRLRSDLVMGRRRLENIMGKDFTPVFTPPWNRCDQKTLELLKDLNYIAVSRSHGCSPSPLDGLPDIQINVDLHTRKEPDPSESRDKLYNEISRSIAGGCCGIMIHHQRMNNAAFEFIDKMIQSMSRRKGFILVNLVDASVEPPA